MWNSIARDLGSTLVGLGILLHQTLAAPSPNIQLLATALALLGVPGVTGLAALWLNGKSNAADTAKPPSSSPAQESSSSS